MLLKNFLLSRAKSELSPQLNHLSKTPGTINREIKKVIAEIDNIVLDNEGETAKEYLKTKRRYQALQTVLSFLVHEGYSQVRQDYISQKSGISKPLINDVLAWLEDLGVCQQIKTRKDGKKAPSIYILTLHNNYLKIVEYFRTKWALLIEVTSTFTEFLSEKISKKTKVNTDQDKDLNVSTCKGFDLLNPISSTEKKIEVTEQENAPSEGRKLELRFQEMDEFMSGEQKKLYMYMLSKETNITEKDAYTIALRMPSDVDWEARKTFEDCVQRFEQNNSQISTPAHFMKIYTEQLTANRKRRNQQAKETTKNMAFGKSTKGTISFDLFKKMLDPNA